MPSGHKLGVTSETLQSDHCDSLSGMGVSKNCEKKVELEEDAHQGRTPGSEDSGDEGYSPHEVVEKALLLGLKGKEVTHLSGMTAHRLACEGHSDRAGPEGSTLSGTPTIRKR